jgi:hypothetical protein
MATQQTIPLFPDNPSYSMRVPLSGTDFILRLDYSGRQDCWYLDVSDANAAPIVLGMKIICDWPIMRKCRLPTRPVGQLIFTDLTSQGQSTGVPGLAPKFADLGRRVALYYMA